MRRPEVTIAAGRFLTTVSGLLVVVSMISPDQLRYSASDVRSKDGGIRIHGFDEVAPVGGQDVDARVHARLDRGLRVDENDSGADWHIDLIVTEPPGE